MLVLSLFDSFGCTKILAYCVLHSMLPFNTINWDLLGVVVSLKSLMQFMQMLMALVKQSTVRRVPSHEGTGDLWNFSCESSMSDGSFPKSNPKSLKLKAQSKGFEKGSNTKTMTWSIFFLQH